jgi:hypothetical protein
LRPSHALSCAFSKRQADVSRREEPMTLEMKVVVFVIVVGVTLLALVARELR